MTFRDLFSSQGFMPHGHCYLWTPGLVWTMVVSDSLIGLAYTSISISLYSLIKRIQLPFSAMFLAFGLFIAACGMTHWMEVWTLWIPSYWFSAVIKIVTALASVATAIVLIPTRKDIIEFVQEAKLINQRRTNIEKERDFSQTLINSSLDGIFAFDQAMRFTVWNQSMEQLTGFRAEEVLGRCATDLFPHLTSKTRELYQRVLRGEKIYIHEQEFIYLTTQEKGYYEGNWTPLYGPNSEVVGGLTVVRDITLRKRAEVEREQFFNQSLDLHLIVSPDGRYRKMNPAFAELLGYSSEEMESILLTSVVHPEDREKCIEALSELMGTQSISHFENRSICKDGSVCWLSWNACIVDSMIFAAARDMTAQREAEARIREQEEMIVHSSKMTSLGEMASGIAHEINNPLQIIQGNAALVKKLLKMNTFDHNEVVASSNIIHETCKGIANIIEGLRAFARESDRDPFQEISVKQIVEVTLSFCHERFLSRKVQLVVEPVREDLIIECRPGQISQVILNLLNNAFYAIEGVQEKWIKLQINDDGNYITIQVSDSGPGVPLGIRGKIFQPFFTTKPPGKGTGLGLSISKGLVEAHYGTLELDTTQSSTSFRVRLPKKPSLNCN